MFCGMATSKPKRDREAALTEAALEHAEALRKQPGCLVAYVMTERGTGMRTLLSVFDSEESFDRAMEVTMPVITKHHLERLREGASIFRLFGAR